MRGDAAAAGAVERFTVCGSRFSAAGRCRPLPARHDSFRGMSNDPLLAAFDHALAEVAAAERARAVTTRSGEPATDRLAALRRELELARERASETGIVDAEWLRMLIRGTMAWIPDSRLRIVAALGGIARSAARTG